jgi:hypothetical protein
MGYGDGNFHPNTTANRPALSRIRKSQGQQTGDGFALAGLITGSIRTNDNRAVILWPDHSDRSLPINPITREVILDGQNLLDPGHPVWGGVTAIFATA